MNQIAIAAVLALVQQGLDAQIPHFGRCPFIQPLPSFEIGNFTGKWFEIMKYKSIFVRGKCISYGVTVVDDKQIEMSLGEVENGEWWIDSRKGTIEAPGVWRFKFDAFVAKINAFFYILDTDYSNYAVAFACNSLTPIMHMEMAWILSRERNISDENLSKAMQTLSGQRISTGSLVYTDQRNCDRT